MVKWLKNFIADWKRKRAVKKKIEELKKKDPFIYK
tara:strand:+ start:1859 stop:1963 length:105 start_codon:yes stop_codon:yes gene_type:complete